MSARKNAKNIHLNRTDSTKKFRGDPNKIGSPLLFSEPEVKQKTPSGDDHIDGAWYDGAGTFIRRDRPAGCLSNRSGEERLYKWVLGKTKSGTHCGACASRAGQIKTVAEWRAMPAPQCKCRCSLVPS